MSITIKQLDKIATTRKEDFGIKLKALFKDSFDAEESLLSAVQKIYFKPNTLEAYEKYSIFEKNYFEKFYFSSQNDLGFSEQKVGLFETKNNFFRTYTSLKNHIKSIDKDQLSFTDEINNLILRENNSQQLLIAEEKLFDKVEEFRLLSKKYLNKQQLKKATGNNYVIDKDINTLKSLLPKNLRTQKFIDTLKSSTLVEFKETVKSSYEPQTYQEEILVKLKTLLNFKEALASPYNIKKHEAEFTKEAQQNLDKLNQQLNLNDKNLCTALNPTEQSTLQNFFYLLELFNSESKIKIIYPEIMRASTNLLIPSFKKAQKRLQEEKLFQESYLKYGYYLLVLIKNIIEKPIQIIYSAALWVTKTSLTLFKKIKEKLSKPKPSPKHRKETPPTKQQIINMAESMLAPNNVYEMIDREYTPKKASQIHETVKNITTSKKKLQRKEINSIEINSTKIKLLMI